MHRRSVNDHLSDVGGAVAWGDDIAARAGLAERVRHDLQVCLEEALANIIMHGRAVGPKDILIELSADAHAVEARISDNCEPFDVAEAPLPEPSAERVGGAGLRLLRAFASELAYESRERRNFLTLTLRDG